MRIIDTKILTGDNHPQLKVKDKLYTVDDRKSTWDKVQEVQNNPNLTDGEKELAVFELTLGKKETKEIMALEMTVQEYQYFTYCIMAAITGAEPEELMEESKRKN